jgi:hypothetical protein
MTHKETLLTLLAVLIYLILCYLIFYRCPDVKHNPGAMVGWEKARVVSAQKKHGDYPIEIKGTKWIMITPKGKIAL